MSDLQRYAVYSSVIDPFGFELKPQDDGSYVKYEDANQRIEELEQERDELLVLADEFRKTGNRVINYGENANQWSHLTCHNDPSNLLTNRDLEQQAKGVEDLASKHLIGYVEKKNAEDYARQLRKKAEKL
jgi:septum formation inhibitor MinC